MTITRMLLTAAAALALLVALPTDGSDVGPDHPFAKNGGGAAGGGTGTGAAGSGGAAGGAAMGGSQGDGGNDKNGSLAALVASPVYGRVASQESPTEEAGPVVSRLGVPCRTLTQTIDIGGQTVPASAVVCRQRDGTWGLNPTQSAQLVPTASGNEPPAVTERAAVGGPPRRVRVIAARPHRPAESAIDRPGR